jgi:hypothetical protein
MTNAISKELFQEQAPKFERGLSIDTHFWVERDGKIIDPLFPELKHVTEKNRVYLHASDDDMFYALDYLRYYSSMFDTVNEHRADWVNTFGYCFVNAMCEMWRNGGDLKMGCLGIKKTKVAVYWFYGHPKNTAKEIIVSHDSGYRNSGMTRYVK